MTEKPYDVSLETPNIHALGFRIKRNGFLYLYGIIDKFFVMKYAWCDVL